MVLTRAPGKPAGRPDLETRLNDPFFDGAAWPAVTVCCRPGCKL